jgi:hypothetical protein
MITSNPDRAIQVAFADHVVNDFAEFGSFAEA